MRKILFIFFTLLLSAQILSLPAQAALAGKKVLMIIAARDFRDEEYQVPRRALEKENVVVTVASSTLGEARGMLGLAVKPDLLLRQVRMEPYAGVIFVGGSGAKEFWDDRLAHYLAREAVRQKKVLGAICMAPVTLARAGLLKGKKVSAWESTSNMIEKTGAVWNSGDISIAGNIITASGPSAAAEFAEKFIALLKASR